MDDILIAGSNLAEIREIKKEFTTRYEIKDLGDLEFYLGMCVTITADYIAVDQERYTLDVLKKYENLLQGLENKNYITPMDET